MLWSILDCHLEESLAEDSCSSRAHKEDGKPTEMALGSREEGFRQVELEDQSRESSPGDYAQR